MYMYTYIPAIELCYVCIWCNIINAQRMRTRVTVLSLCVCVCVCVSAVYQLLTRFVLQIEHVCRLYATLQRFSTYRFI